MDEIDKRIVEILLQDGRTPLEQVAQRVNLSRPAVQQRVRRLEARGVIKGYSVRVDWAQMGMPVLAEVSLVTNGLCTVIGTELLQRTVPGAIITDCHRVIGQYCLTLWIRAATPLALQDQIDAIRSHDGVTSTHSTMILSSLREGMMDDALPTPETPARDKAALG